MMTNKLEEKVTVDLDYYLKIKEAANREEVTNILLKALVWNNPDLVKEVLINEGIQLEVTKSESSSFLDLDFEVNMDNFKQVQELKIRARNFAPVFNRTEDELSELQDRKEEESKSTPYDKGGAVKPPSRYA